MDTAAEDRESYVKSLNKKQLRKVLNGIFDNYFDPLGRDAPVYFRGPVEPDEYEDGCPAALVWESCGESLLDD